MGHRQNKQREHHGEIGSLSGPWAHLGIMDPGWLGRLMEPHQLGPPRALDLDQGPEGALDPDSEDFYRPGQEHAFLSIPVTPKKKIIPPEVKKEAVEDCVDRRIAVSVVAEKCEVHPSTIRNWVKHAGKSLPSREKTPTPRKADNPSILNYFSPKKVNLLPPNENAMDMSSFLQVKVEEDQFEIAQEHASVRRKSQSASLDQHLVYQSDNNSDYIQKKRQEFRGKRLVPGLKRSRDHKTTMLFMESGFRQSPWYTWQVTAGKDNSGKYDMQKKAKRGPKTTEAWSEEVEEGQFRLTSFKRRREPARCFWSAKCCLCAGNEVHPMRLDIKRKSSYLWNPYDKDRRPLDNKLGRMSTIEWRTNGSTMTLTAHYYCLFYAADPGMIQSSKWDHVDTQLEGFPIKAVLEQMEKSEADCCVFCNGFGAASQCANVKCLDFGWYHFPCGLANGCVQQEGKTWCGRCSKGPLRRRQDHQVVDGKARKSQGRGRQKAQSVQLSQSSQELFKNSTRDKHPFKGRGPQEEGELLSRDGKVFLSSALQPISAQLILTEIDARKEERSKMLEEPLRCVHIAQVQQIPKEEFLAGDKTSVKVETSERYFIFDDCLPGEQGPSYHTLPRSSDHVLEQVELFDDWEEGNIPTSKDLKKPAPPHTAASEELRPESRSLLEDDDEGDDLVDTEPFSPCTNLLLSPAQPKDSLDEDSGSIILIEDEVETREEEKFRQTQMENMRRQLELTDSLLKAKRAELEQLEIKRNEEVSCYEKKLQMKESEIASMRERHLAEQATKQEEWKAEMARELKEQAQCKANEILKLRADLERAHKEKEEVLKEKKEALAKLNSIIQIVAPSEVKREVEYVERPTTNDDSTPSGVKREMEEMENDEGVPEKRPRYSQWAAL